MTAIRGVLFDKDGTLIDFGGTWEPINRRAARFASRGDEELADRLLRVCGMDPATGEVEADSLFAASSTGEIAGAMIEHGAIFAIDELTEALDRFFVEGAHHSVPLTDLPELFETLRAHGLVLGIASSDNEASIRMMTERLGVSALLHFVAGYDSGFGVKPGPGMVHAFADAVGLDASEIAVVGDNTHDLHMARAAGAGLAVGVLSGTGKHEHLEPIADHVIDGVDDLLALLAAP